MKFIHVSELLLSSVADKGEHWDEERNEERLNALSEIMSYAREEGVDLILITGGLFSHMPVERELNEVNDIFADYKRIKVAIIGGATDPVKRISPINSFEWSSNVKYILADTPKTIVFDELKTEIVGYSVSYNSDFKGKAINTSISKKDGGEPIRIAMIPGGSNDELKNAFNKDDFSYVAVGGRKYDGEILENLIYAPGEFNPDIADYGREYGLYMGEISEDDGSLKALNFKPLSPASYIALLIEITPETSIDDFNAMVEREILKRGEKNIYRLKIVGDRKFDETFDLSALKRKYRIGAVIDDTTPKYDFHRLFAEHSQDIIGFYIGSIMTGKKEMSPVEKKAMYYGIDALINTTN